MMRNHADRTARSAVALLAILAATPAWAGQEPPRPLPEQSLEELSGIEVASVYGASKHDQRASEAPAAVTVITAREIATFGWRTLADVLDNVRGFYVTYDNNYAYVGVNGFGRPTDYNNRVLFLVDGHRLNDNIYDATPIGTDLPVDLAMVDRIEIIRGPGSALYGTSAFFAVVNLITKSGGAFDGTESALEVASERLFRARVSYGTAPRADRQFLVSATRLSADGIGRLYYPEYDDASSNFGVSSGNDADESTNVYASGQWGGLVAQALYGTRGKRVPTGAWATVFNDPRNRTTDSRGWLHLSRLFKIGETDLTARAGYDHVGYDGTYIYDDGVSRDRSRGDWITAEVTADRRVSSAVRVTGGFEYRDNIHQDQWSYYEESPDDLTVDARGSSWQYGLYGQGEWALAPKVTLTVGGRVDSWSIADVTARPRVALIVHPVRDGSLKILHGGAFRAPSVYELYYYRGHESPADLAPETTRNTEVVYEQYLGGRVRLSGSVFHAHIDHLISEAGAGDDIFFVNSPRVEATGAAGDLEIRWPNGLLARAGYSNQRVEEHDSSEPLSNAPRHLGVASLVVPFSARRGTVGVNLTYVGPRMTTHATMLEATTLTNLTLRFRPVGSRLSLAASVYNLFDVRHAHPVGREFRQDAIAQARRGASVRVVFGF